MLVTETLRTSRRDEMIDIARLIQELPHMKFDGPRSRELRIRLSSDG